ncbi:MAG TPA: asparagine synthase (glutamine-hydrolyzing) [Candidatus Polarisedimenticolaceae bacterium]|nr:asparagine synthase (glutamine-hydrolyzing) [Candidatus Polarisedimenticolaceae bacterium]
MCGIVATFNKDRGRPVDPTRLAAMTEILRHRGPDQGAILVDGPIGLGHRRLSVLDLELGLQPMAGPSGATWIAYNGEVYNYREIRKELVSRGVRFKTTSDTEVVLASYEVFGLEFVDRLNGMFAFAILDQRNGSLVLGRDRLGIKPLYVWDGPETLIAASEIKAILLHPGAPNRPREEALAEYVAFRQLSGYRTMFDGIEAMTPGSLRVLGPDGSKVIRYWSPGAVADPSVSTTPQRSATDFRSLIESSVEMQLVSDVPLGTFNSGGLDSSVVTALAKRHVPGILRSFSVGFAEESYDERPHARRLASHVGAVQEEIVGDPQEFARDLPLSIWHHDEPLNHANSVFIALLSRFAKEKVTVVLTGEGSDELFGGYPRYRLVRGLEKIRRWGTGLERLVALPLVFSRGRKADLIRSSLGRSDAHLLADNARYTPDLDVHAVCGGTALGERMSRAPNGRDLMTRLRVFEIETYLHNVLERMDKMTMSAGLEARVPFLDHRIVEFALRLPTPVLMPFLRNKAVVRDAAAALVPPTNVSRSKSGFGVPVGEWMRGNGSLSHLLEMLCEPRTLERGWWDRAALLRIVEEHRSGVDHSEVLWSLANCELWARLMLEGEGRGIRLTRVPDGIPVAAHGVVVPQT